MSADAMCVEAHECALITGEENRTRFHLIVGMQRQRPLPYR